MVSSKSKINFKRFENTTRPSSPEASELLPKTLEAHRQTICFKKNIHHRDRISSSLAMLQEKKKERKKKKEEKRREKKIVQEGVCFWAQPLHSTTFLSRSSSLVHHHKPHIWYSLMVSTVFLGDSRFWSFVHRPGNSHSPLHHAALSYAFNTLFTRYPPAFHLQGSHLYRIAGTLSYPKRKQSR